MAMDRYVTFFVIYFTTHTQRQSHSYLNCARVRVNFQAETYDFCCI